MTVTSLVPAYLAHPHVDDEDIREGQTKQGNLLFKYFFMNIPFWRIEAFGVDDVEVADVVNPDPLGTSFPGDWSV